MYSNRMIRLELKKLNLREIEHVLKIERPITTPIWHVFLVMRLFWVFFCFQKRQS